MNTYIEIFWRFLMLGLVSFGGPAAHIGYFQRAFVQERAWLDNQAYGRIVALSQFLPGPGSSQVGFAIGLERAGLLGGIMAFLGFTLPSFLVMWLLAALGSHFSDTTTFVGLVYGLKLFAVVVVADAVWTMGQAFCKKTLHKVVALASALALVFFATLSTQLLVIVGAAVLGAIMCENKAGEDNSINLSSKVNKSALLLFVFLLVGLPFITQSNHWLALFNDFYQAGSLVFGGGHVVLPLLQQTVGEQLSPDHFLTGYAAAQAVPGPMFSLAAYLGGQLISANSFLGALVATLAIFLPGFLLILAFNRAWHALSGQLRVASAMSAVNAAVVGILAAALYQPIAVSAIHSYKDLAIVVAGFVLLRFFKLPIYTLVASFAAIGVIVTI